MNINTISKNLSGSSDALKEAALSYWSKVPLFSRFIVYSSITIYILSWIVLDIVLFFCNIPQYTLFEYRIWTLFTTVFVNLNIFTLIFALWSWLEISSKFETRNGTILFILNFFLNSVLIQSIYLTLTVFLSILFPSLLQKLSAGLWPVIILLITLECLQNQETDYKLFSLSIKQKYYPWLLLLFFTIVNQFAIQIDVLSGIIFGYLYHYLIERYIEIPIDIALFLERSEPLKWIKSFPSKLL